MFRATSSDRVKAGAEGRQETEAKNPVTKFNKQKQKHMGSQAGAQNKQLSRLNQRRHVEPCDNWLRKKKHYIHTD